jgi:hypothetical protein
MPRANLAERIFEIVITSSRAASIVGDLEEEGSNRSASWFWLSLLRIFVSHLFQDLRAHWLRMIWLGFSEFVIFVIVAMLLESTTHYYLPSAHYLFYGFPILLGWHLARRSHGRELASGVSLISMFWIYEVVSMLPMFWIPVETRSGWGLPGNPFTMLMNSMLHVTPFNILIILGVLLCRFRTNVRYRKLHFS